MKKTIFLTFTFFSLVRVSCFGQIEIDSSTVVIYDIPPFKIENWFVELEDSVVDIDSNFYKLIQLGNQVWFRNNLEVSKYNNGQEIPFVKEDSLWVLTENDAYTINESYSSNNAYYNYKVVANNMNVCPVGFRVPDSTDWAELELFAEKVNNDFNLGHYYMPRGDTIHLREKNVDCWEIFEANNWHAWHLSFSNDAKGYKSGINGEYKLYGNFGYWWVRGSKQITSSYTRIFIDRCFGIDDIHLEDYFVKNGAYVENHGLPIRCIQE